MGEEENNRLLSVEKLEVVYHHISTAVQGVSLNVGENQIVALLGTNGAGKSTVLRAVSGFIGVDDARVTEGAILFDGKHIENQPPHTITTKGVVLVPEQDKVFDNLTVEEQLQVCFSSKLKASGVKDPLGMVFGYFPALKRVRNRSGGYLSGGERQMLAIATALLCAPRLLLIDELSLGLAPIVVAELMELLTVIRDEQAVTVLLVEQNALAALEIADYGYIMENGRIVFDGEPEKLKCHQDIQEFYLGQGYRDGKKSYRDIKQYRRTRRWYG